MNIFVLAAVMAECAKYHSDKHVVKMIVEMTQLLCTAHWNNDGAKPFDEAYRKTHSGHPWALWVGESLLNYRWTCDQALALCDEYNRRFEKGDVQHKCLPLIERLRETPCKTWRSFEEARNPGVLFEPVAVGRRTPSPAKKGSPKRKLKLKPAVVRVAPPRAGLTPMPVCTGSYEVPEWCRALGAVWSYRAYYSSADKQKIHRWSRQEAPRWLGALAARQATASSMEAPPARWLNAVEAE
jgi:hypothetical protein